MEPMMAEIRLFAGPYIPRGWHACDGTILFINQYQKLFDLIGHRFGGGNPGTFALPDLRGRTVIGASKSRSEAGGYEIGSYFGQETVGLTFEHMPTHSHKVIFDKEDVTRFRGFATLNGAFNDGGKSSPEGNFLGVDSGSGTAPYYAPGARVPVGMHADAIKFENVLIPEPKLDVGYTGGQQPHSNMMPSLVLQYIICINGIYPTPG